MPSFKRMLVANQNTLVQCNKESKEKKIKNLPSSTYLIKTEKILKYFYIMIKRNH